MPDTIPTLNDVVLYALHSARLSAAEQSGDPAIVVAVPTVGVCLLINEEGPLLKREDLELVQAALDELAATTVYVKRVPMKAGPGYIVHPDAPPGRSASMDEARPPFGGACGSHIVTGGAYDARELLKRTHRHRGPRAR